MAVGGTVLATGAVAQSQAGNTKDFYSYSFITTKSGDDLAGFYGSEEFMDLFCVLPFVGTLMMRGGTFDEEGTIHTTGVPGTMMVSMVFSEEEDVETEETLWFNKRERFKDVCLGFTCWDMVTNFGFHTLPDGRVEVYHRGEYFKGSIPPVSLVVYLIFQLHARWVFWATEHHIQKYAFTAETEEEEAVEELSRRNMVWNLLKNEVWRDTKAMLFGWRQKSDDHRDRPSSLSVPQEEEEEKELEENRKTRVPHHTKLAGSDAVQYRIDTTVANDIAADRVHHAKFGSMYSEEGLGYQDQGGNVVWEMLRKTNNPEAYQKAARAARARGMARRITRRETMRHKYDNAMNKTKTTLKIEKIM